MQHMGSIAANWYLIRKEGYELEKRAGYVVRRETAYLLRVKCTDDRCVLMTG